jgi:hypothetical protein
MEAAEPPPAMVATRSFAVPGGHAIVMVAWGDRFRQTNQLVRLFPERFAPCSQTPCKQTPRTEVDRCGARDEVLLAGRFR